MSNDLTNEAFWETYWSRISLPVSADLNFKNDRVIAQEIINAIPKRANPTALEIGCAPGKWLSFLAKNLNCRVTGIEYVGVAAEKTIQNLKMQDIENFRVLHDDFFNHQLKELFDIVISLGFIEHFDNYSSVLEDQLKLVAPNGFLVIGIPRFVGINYLIQKGLDCFIKNKLLPSHNLKTMNLDIYKQFAKKHNLTIMCNKYIGGFEPGLFPVGEVPNLPARVVFKVILKVCNLLFGHVNSHFTSSYQIAILKK